MRSIMLGLAALGAFAASPAQASLEDTFDIRVNATLVGTARGLVLCGDMYDRSCNGIVPISKDVSFSIGPRTLQEGLNIIPLPNYEFFNTGHGGSTLTIFNDHGYLSGVDLTDLADATWFGSSCNRCVSITASASNFEVTGGIPEPKTWAMMLMGFGAIGYGLRRQRRSIAYSAQTA